MDFIDKDFINSGQLFDFMNELGTLQCKRQAREQTLIEEEMAYNKEHGVEKAEEKTFQHNFWMNVK